MQAVPASAIDVDVHLGVDAADTASLFHFVDQLVTDGRRIGTGSVQRGLTRRQSRGSTALGRGIALPHATVRNLPRPRLVYTRLCQPIPMDAPDGAPVVEALTLLVRYPASPTDHVLLERLRDPHMNPVLVELLRQDRRAEALARLLGKP